MENNILVENLSKTYRVAERAPGLLASIKSLVKSHYREVEAVREISFRIEHGEMVGFIGPNGAGKTTTLKMLSGLLYPTSGSAQINGFTPWERKNEYLRQISMVMGNRSQMIWDIPPLDSFRVIAQIYRVPTDQFIRTRDELIHLLDMEELLQKPVRNLSLGERMKCELTAGLLHRPKVLFLDEPTLGLDISMQRRFRQFIRAYNQQHEVSVILTSHYMADVVELCPRVILIHRGKLLFDGILDALAETLAPFKLIKLRLNEGNHADSFKWIKERAEIIEQNGANLTLRVARADTAHLAGYVLEHLPVADLSVENAPIEAVIDQIYQEGEL